MELVPMDNRYSLQIIDLFNAYIQMGQGTFFDQPLPHRIFPEFLGMAKGLPTVQAIEGNELLGFAMLRPYSPLPAFSSTAEISFYVHPGHLRTGIGKNMVCFLETQAKQSGLCYLLSSVCSGNQTSIAFHHALGFSRCGTFVEIAKKNGQLCDVYWYQKHL